MKGVYEEKVRDLEDKVSFFRQNQKLISENDQNTSEQLKDLQILRNKV